MTSFLTVANNNNIILTNANLVWNVASNTYFYEANNALYADKDGNPLRPPSDNNANTFVSNESSIITFYTQHYDVGNSQATESISIEKTTVVTQNSVIVSYNNTQINALGTFLSNSVLTITPNTFIINTSSNTTLSINKNSISANSNTSNSTLKFEVGFVVDSSKFQVVNTYSNSTINSVVSFIGNTSGLVVSNTFSNSSQNTAAQFFGNTAGILVSSNTANSTANLITRFTGNSAAIVISNAYANSTHTVNTFYSANASYFGLALSDANTTYITNTNISSNVSSLAFQTIEPQYLSTGVTANTRTRNLVINVSSISGNISIANTANTVNTVFAVPFVTTPVTITDNYTIGDYDYWIINNKATSTCTLTFPAASAWPARVINVKSLQNRTVVSATSNIVPLDGNTAAAAILSAKVGNWAELVSDGINWVIMKAN
jgi:hypothetical protein